MLHTKKELFCHLAAILAGREAEEAVFGPDHITNGAGNDLEKARQMAVQMHKWHMLTAEDEKDAVRMAMNEGKRLAAEILKSERAALERLYCALMDRETLTGEEIQAILA